MTGTFIPDPEQVVWIAVLAALAVLVVLMVSS